MMYYELKVKMIVTRYCEDDPFYDTDEIFTETVGTFCSQEAAEAICARFNKALGRESFYVSACTVEDTEWTNAAISAYVEDFKEEIDAYDAQASAPAPYEIEEDD